MRGRETSTYSYCLSGHFWHGGSLSNIYTYMHVRTLSRRRWNDKTSPYKHFKTFSNMLWYSAYQYLNCNVSLLKEENHFESDIYLIQLWVNTVVCDGHENTVCLFLDFGEQIFTYFEILCILKSMFNPAVCLVFFFNCSTIFKHTQKSFNFKLDFGVFKDLKWQWQLLESFHSICDIKN